jgi:transcriptional regulator with XRE-family HTH domain
MPPSKGVRINRHTLRSLRELNGLSLSGLQVATGQDDSGRPAISLSYLSEIESGTKGRHLNVSPEKVGVLARALNVPVAALLAQVEDEVAA